MESKERKLAQQIIDGTAEVKGFRGNPLRIGPSAAEIKAVERPKQSVLWHMRHRPYRIGGDSGAEQRNKRTE